MADPHAVQNAASYDTRNYDGEFEAQRHRSEAICDRLKARGPFDRAADIGCLGGVLAPVYRTAGVRRLDGFDVSEASLEHARTLGLEAYRWDAGAEPCPVGAGCYDLVIANEVIEHIADTEFALRQFHQMLRPEGWLVLSTPNLAFWYSRWRVVTGRAPIGAPGVSLRFRRDPAIDLLHAHIGTLSEWQALIEHCGFAVVEVFATSYLQSRAYPRRVVSWFDRLLSRRPSLGGNIVFIARR